MAKVAAFHTDTREYLPTHREIHHNKDTCPDGKKIKLEHRKSGTGGKPICDQCPKYS